MCDLGCKPPSHSPHLKPTLNSNYSSAKHAKMSVRWWFKMFWKRRTMHSHYDRSFYKVYGRWITHLNALLRNSLRNLSGYLTSCLTGDDQMSESVVLIVLTHQHFCQCPRTATWRKTIIPSSGKGSFHACLSIFSLSIRTQFLLLYSYYTVTQTLRDTGVVMVRSIICK